MHVFSNGGKFPLSAKVLQERIKKTCTFLFIYFLEKGKHVVTSELELMKCRLQGRQPASHITCKPGK